MISAAHDTAHLIPHMIGYLREAHLVRGTAYLGVAARTMQSSTAIVPRAGHYDLERIHLAVPSGLAGPTVPNLATSQR